MKKTSLIAALLLAATFAAAPAMAKTSVSKSLLLCKTTAEKQEPAPKSVSVDKRKVSSTPTTVTVPVTLKGADDTSARFTCTVDRETAATTLTAGN